MSWHEDWETHVAAGGDEIDMLLRAKKPLIAGAMLRPFFEAYEIVADVLRDAPAEIGEKDLTKKALGVGRQYVAQNRVRSNESVSALLFATARQVAADQHLLEPAADLDERRTAFRDELRGILGDMDKVEQIAREQFYAREMERRACAASPRSQAASGTPAHAIRWAHDHGGAPSVRSSAVWPVLIGVGVLAGAIAAGIGALSLADALTATGLPNPGPATTYGLPFVRAAGEIAAVLAAGSFLFAAFLVPPQTNGVLDAAGYRALRLGTAASAVWTVCAALLVPLTVSDVSGQPLREHLNPVSIWSAASLVDTAAAWRWTAFIAAAVTLASLPVLRWSWTPVLLAGALITLVPLGLTGHSSAGGAHDLATNSLLIHLIAGALWAGGLLALLAHAMRSGEHADLAARRFSALALWCFVAMAASGVVNALVRIQLPELVRSEYGWLVIGKFVALCVLGVIGWRQRRSGLAALEHRSGSPRAADPAGAGRGGRLRGDVRHRGRVGPHTATAAAARNRVPSRSRSAMTSPGRRPSRGCCSTGGSTSSSARPRSSWQCCIWSGCAGCAVAATRGRWAARWRGCAAARCCCSPRRRGWAATCLRCFRCTWWRTCCCPCWCRSCWCWARP